MMMSNTDPQMTFSGVSSSEESLSDESDKEEQQEKVKEDEDSEDHTPGTFLFISRSYYFFRKWCQARLR